MPVIAGIAGVASAAPMALQEAPAARVAARKKKAAGAQSAWLRPRLQPKKAELKHIKPAEQVAGCLARPLQYLITLNHLLNETQFLTTQSPSAQAQ